MKHEDALASQHAPHVKQSFEDHVKANVVLWVLGTLLAGFLAGIGAVKWIDERYRVEPISMSEKNELMRAKADFAELQKSYENLATDVAQRDKAIRSSNERLAALTGENERLRGLQASVTPDSSTGAHLHFAADDHMNDPKIQSTQSRANLSSEPNALPLSQAQSAEDIELSKLQHISLRVRYTQDRASDAKRISQKLGLHFQAIQLNECRLPCSRTPATIDYGDDLTPALAFRVARLLTQAGIRGFTEPAINSLDVLSRGSVTVYLY